MSHRELGAAILKRLTVALADIADVEVAPKMEGYQMFTIFIPKKSKADVKKSAVHTSVAPDGDEEPEKKKEKGERVKSSEEKNADDDLMDGIF
jgi:translation initiation factor IF-3